MNTEFVMYVAIPEELLDGDDSIEHAVDVVKNAGQWTLKQIVIRPLSEVLAA